MQNSREEAEALRLGIESGYVMRDDVIRWADELIALSAEPDPTVCEIAVMTQAKDFQICDLLSRVNGDVRPRVVLALVLRQMVNLIEAGVMDHSRAARWVFADAVSEEEKWGEFWNEALWYDDQLDLAESGHVADRPEAVRMKFVRFMTRVSSSYLDAA